MEIFSKLWRNLVKVRFNFYSKVYNKNVAKIDFLSEKGELGTVARLLEVNTKPGDKILELGCGTGLLGKSLQSKFLLDGVDISSKMLKVLLKENSFYNSLYKMPLEVFLETAQTEIYDAVVASSVFQFLSPNTMVKTFANVSKVLTAKGHFIFSFDLGKNAHMNSKGFYEYDIKFLKKCLEKHFNIVSEVCLVQGRIERSKAVPVGILIARNKKI